MPGVNDETGSTSEYPAILSAPPCLIAARRQPCDLRDSCARPRWQRAPSSLWIDLACIPRAQDGSEILRGRGAWLELADAAETKPIEIENSRRVKHSANGTLGGSRSDRPGRSQQKTGAEEGSTLDTGPMPAWMHKKTPAVGSAEWEQEQQETDRQERAVRRAIEGICRGC